MVKVITDGRDDIEAYFGVSGVFEYSTIKHTPFLVFTSKNDEVKVNIVYSANNLLRFPDETPVMGQWRGEWKSDFFQFTVGQYREYKERQRK